MKKYNLIFIALAFAAVIIPSGCKKQLEVGNPNAPTVPQNVTEETGLVSLAQGGIYFDGLRDGLGWLGNSYFSLPMGYMELLGDNLGAEASNNQVTTIGVPDYIILDNGDRIENTASSVGIIRSYNNRASTGAGNNPIIFHWLSMYAMNKACNEVLAITDNIVYPGDAATKAATVKAWCYFWKGFAYSVIGSVYYAGVIQNDPLLFSNEFVSHEVIIAESDKYYNMAKDALDGISSAGDYNDILGKLIPAFCQVGLGGVLTPQEWIRNINTMLARNILVNKLSPFVNGNPDATITGSSTTTITAADWAAIKELTTAGIQEGDKVFTGRSLDANGFFSPTGGTAASQTTGPNNANTFKISERFIQNFKTGDKRFENNFTTETVFKNDYSFATRYSMESGGLGISGVYMYGSLEAGEYEQYIAGSYEENALMLAEANIRTGSIPAGLALIDDVRAYKGAGIAPVAGTGLGLAAALTELTMERRVSLIYRGLTFLDNRRWGWAYDISKGGGFYGAHVYNSTTGLVNTNATINYNFMDYWDVPDDEVVLNPPSETSFATTNPNF